MDRSVHAGLGDKNMKACMHATAHVALNRHHSSLLACIAWQSRARHAYSATSRRALGRRRHQAARARGRSLDAPYCRCGGHRTVRDVSEVTMPIAPVRLLCPCADTLCRLYHGAGAADGGLIRHARTPRARTTATPNRSSCAVLPARTCSIVPDMYSNHRSTAHQEHGAEPMIGHYCPCMLMVNKSI
jgi:hypothetical protein